MLRARLSACHSARREPPSPGYPVLVIPGVRKQGPVVLAIPAAVVAVIVEVVAGAVSVGIAVGDGFQRGTDKSGVGRDPTASRRGFRADGDDAATPAFFSTPQDGLSNRP